MCRVSLREHDGLGALAVGVGENASLDLVGDRLGHHRDAVDDRTDGRTQCAPCSTSTVTQYVHSVYTTSHQPLHKACTVCTLHHAKRHTHKVYTQHHTKCYTHKVYSCTPCITSSATQSVQNVHPASRQALHKMRRVCSLRHSSVTRRIALCTLRHSSVTHSV